MRRDCFTVLLQILPHQPAVVATIVQGQGSIPREVGARMIITPTGLAFGSVGGGAGEAKVLMAAQQVLETGIAQMVNIDLSGSRQRQTQGVCGGWLQVWLECWQGEAAIALAQQICDRLTTGQTATLATPLSSLGSSYLVQSPGQPDQPDHRPKTDVGSDSSTDPAVFPAVFIDTLQPAPTLLIVGAGHCGIQLAKIADWIGFETVVQDDRPEWANSSHYPQAGMILLEPIADAVTRLAQHTQLYAALLTRGFQYDVEALNVLLRRDLPCVYLGMIGSRRRVQQVFAAVTEAGIAPERLQHIHAPIGLDIGALTPEEIAVSISAELIAVRREGWTKGSISQARGYFQVSSG